VAVQSHWFSVGPTVPWAEAGVGAVATQSFVKVSYGPDGLALMRDGTSAPDALAKLVEADENANVRQVAMIDAEGRVAAHTGSRCIQCAGHYVGENFSAQANLMQRDTVWAAMAKAFESTKGPLADRMLAALAAAEKEGGDIRGRQSAAIVVAPAAGEPWRLRVDLRVEDHADPVAELRRLLQLQRAYALAGEADELMGEGRYDEAAPLYLRAAELAPESDELLFWAGLGIAQNGDLDAGVDAVRRAASVHPGWLTLLDRLAPEFAPAGAAVRAALRDKTV